MQNGPFSWQFSFPNFQIQIPEMISIVNFYCTLYVKMLNEQKKKIDDVQCQWLPGQSEYSYFYNQNTMEFTNWSLNCSCVVIDGV